MKEFKSTVLTDNVRPIAVMATFQTLLKSSELYKEANISVNDSLNNEDKAQHEHEDESIDDSSSDESDAFIETNDKKNLPVMTLLDEQSVDKCTVLSVAPGKGQRPISIFKDPNSEYLAFPTIFCGQTRVENSKRRVPIYYSDIC